MGGSSKSAKQESITRYAPYLEEAHNNLVRASERYGYPLIGSSPFSGYVDIEVDDAFFGAGYIISSFPSLYDMYGKFMAGLDIDSLYAQLFEDTINSAEVRNLVSAEAAFIEDDIDTNIAPRFQTGMRDINSVMASSFVIGKTLIEETRLKSVAKFSADLKYKLIPVVNDRWKTHLDWNKQVVNLYAELMKFYYASKMDINEVNYSFTTRDRLWPFTVLDLQRAIVGAMTGAQSSVTSGVAGGPSQTQKAIGGALSGAAMGASVGGAYGAVAGGVIGLAASFL